MQLGKQVVSKGEAVVDRVLCVVGAVAFSQAPEFMQQYLQRLGGRLDEARRILGQYEDIARQAGITLENYIARTNANSDPVVAKLGGVMENTVTRVHDLAAAQAALQDASMFGRPFAFLRHLDAEIGRATWAVFKPAVPTTIEGAVYALAGAGLALGVYYGCIHYPVTRIWRRHKARKGAVSGGAAGPDAQPPEADAGAKV